MAYRPSLTFCPEKVVPPVLLLLSISYFLTASLINNNVGLGVGWYCSCSSSWKYIFPFSDVAQMTSDIQSGVPVKYNPTPTRLSRKRLYLDNVKLFGAAGCYCHGKLVGFAGLKENTTITAIHSSTGNGIVNVAEVSFSFCQSSTILWSLVYEAPRLPHNYFIICLVIGWMATITPENGEKGGRGDGEPI